jgi:hypothetical protein
VKHTLSERLRQTGCAAGRRIDDGNRPITDVFISPHAPLSRNIRRRVEGDARVWCAISAVEIVADCLERQVSLDGHRPGAFHAPTLKWAVSRSTVALATAPDSSEPFLEDDWFATQFPSATWITLVRTTPRLVKAWQEYLQSLLPHDRVYTYNSLECLLRPRSIIQ